MTAGTYRIIGGPFATPDPGLLPHEAVCNQCHGEGRIEFSGVHPARAGDVSVMETPDTWSEWCRECDGKGIVLNDRRVSDRRADLTTELVNRITADRDRLTAENRRLRVIVHEQSMLIDTAARHLRDEPGEEATNVETH